MVEDFEMKMKFFMFLIGFISCSALLNVNCNQIHRQKREEDVSIIYNKIKNGELDGLFLAAGTFTIECLGLHR